MAGTVSTASGQSDAKAACDAGKKAYQAERFERARELLLKASQTDNRNPEVFLWLGKAHFQLGELKQAMGAWRKTLALAPDEPYAAKMLRALRREVTDVNVRIMLAERLLEQRLPSAAASECRALLALKALTERQRVRSTTLLAEASLDLGKNSDVVSLVLEIRTKHPEHADESKLARIFHTK